MYPKFDKKVENSADQEILSLMPVELVEEFNAFTFGKSGNTVKVAALDPELATLKSFTEKRFGKVEWFSATTEDVEAVLKAKKGDGKSEILRLAENGANKNGNMVELVDKIISSAISKKASDVHIEPFRSSILVRLRIDGMLHSFLELPREVHAAFVARFKILSGLKLDEYRRPQDGRIDPEEFPEVSIRVSTIPTLHGEKIALRVLDDSLKNLSIEDLGFSAAHKEIIHRNMEKPFGMIVASGPTGSGKTTTLYSLLNLIQKEGINISTLEDPVEYALAGVNQIQVNPRVDLTFASGLKSLLRQDPDVIMVGEVRDSETMLMASGAALTGHLVLTTIHTNDAPSTLTRFLEMNVEDFVVAGTVNLVIAQRLIRKVCVQCGKPRKLDKTLIKKIKSRGDVIEALQKSGRDPDAVLAKAFTQGKGCDACIGTGYSGRCGIFELLELGKEVHDLVLEGASSDRIKEAASKNGFCDIVSDGLEKVFNGATTFEEVLRTTRNG